MAVGGNVLHHQLSWGCAMIAMAVIGGVIVLGLAWAGLHDYQRRRKSGRPSVAENFKMQREIDRQRISEKAGPDGGSQGA